MIVLYALMPAAQAMPTADVLDSHLSVMVQGAIAAVYQEADSAPSPDRDAVIAYGTVLADLARRVTVLPARFGTVVDNVEDLAALVHAKEPELDRRLQQIAGQVEMIIHVAHPVSQPTSAPATSGRDYILARATEHRLRQSARHELRSAVAPYCREVRWLPAVHSHRLACLVPAERANALTTKVESLALTRPGIAITGPFPVLSFAEEDIADE
jgi:hypothetical protein